MSLLEKVAEYIIRLEGTVKKGMTPNEVFELNAKRDRVNHILRRLRERQKRQNYGQSGSDRGRRG